jgi:hypothetical protein
MFVLNKLHRYIVEHCQNRNDREHEIYTFINDMQYALSVYDKCGDLVVEIEDIDYYYHIKISKTIHDEYPLYRICVKYINRNQAKFYILLEPSMEYRNYYYLTFNNYIDQKNIKLVKIESIDQEMMDIDFDRWMHLFESMN